MPGRSFHRRYFSLVEQVERTLRVARWRSGDIDLWPLARQDLFLDMFRGDDGDTAPPPPPFLVRAVASLAVPLTNLWKSRKDLTHFIGAPRRADAIFLGDGVSLDRLNGAWHDRFGGPIADMLERQGRSSFMMQPGNLTRLPWARPSFAANRIAVRAATRAAMSRDLPLDLPDHAAVLRRLAESGVAAPSLSQARLARRARTVAMQAAEFERILRVVRPKLAFVVTYYAGLGQAFALACRRRGVLCVDLQHCPQDGGHRAYHWWSLPSDGYTTLPGLFWNWTEMDAARISAWAGTLSLPWHRAIHGGHTQIAALADSVQPDVLSGRPYDREILVALQPIGGQRERWKALAAQIEASPAGWRWWIRRHPSASASQDAEYAELLMLRRENVLVEEASHLPLPVLMRRMSVLVSLASGAAGEAAQFGVPALFLSSEASGPFAGLIERGQARLVDVDDLISAIAQLPRVPAGQAAPSMPDIGDVLCQVERIAEDYAQLTREQSARSCQTKTLAAGSHLQAEN
jgi:hypothetical protein